MSAQIRAAEAEDPRHAIPRVLLRGNIDRSWPQALQGEREAVLRFAWAGCWGSLLTAIGAIAAHLLR